MLRSYPLSLFDVDQVTGGTQICPFTLEIPPFDCFVSYVFFDCLQVAAVDDAGSFYS